MSLQLVVISVHRFHHDKEKPVTILADFIETSQDSQYFTTDVNLTSIQVVKKILNIEAEILLQTAETLIRLLLRDPDLTAIPLSRF